MVGDCASLYARIAYVRRVIDDLLETPLETHNRARIRKKIGTLWAEVDNLGSITRDLVGPLDRLHSAIHEQRRAAGQKGRG